MNDQTYIYLLVAALTIYAIRALPLTLIQKEINNTFIRSFLYYVPYVTLAVMAFPAIITATNNVASGVTAFLAAIIVAWIDGNLFKVAVASCIAVYLTELIL
ncbi:AzlD domain-containing protein [Ihubacter sp. mB4P-1]|uniref:AzlD domain-containing protein n=1 Tax=Ihubacter sp. mB4P-1 TaxID=3242370 RepID=UPI001379A5AC